MSEVVQPAKVRFPAAFLIQLVHLPKSACVDLLPQASINAAGQCTDMGRAGGGGGSAAAGTPEGGASVLTCMISEEKEENHIELMAIT